MQFAQNVVGKMARSLRFAVDVDRHIEVLAAHLLDEMTQVQDRGIQIGPGRKFFVVNGENKGTGTALLLGELAEIAVTGHPQHLKPFRFNRLSQCANAQAGGVLGTEIFIDDDDGKTELH